MLRRVLGALAEAVMRWPVAKEVAQTGMGDAAVSDRTRQLGSRLHGVTTTASICPYCAVGCGTLVHTKDGQIVGIEGNPESPINEGTLCPKGADTFQYTVNPKRLTRVLYRRPYGTRWEEVDLEWAMERIAGRMKETRDRTFRSIDEEGRRLNHTGAIGFLGGAALDNEENYLIKKFCVGMGIVSVENQARI